jgi:hypothetical protein
MINIHDEYETRAPSQQNAIDIFAGEWASALPSDLGLNAGAAALFDYGTVQWAVEQLGSIRGFRILELGPLEGGHSYCLANAGAASILAIEANKRAYLKCLIAKEITGSNANFILGDFNKYLDCTTETFDLVFATGVLYHMVDPVELLVKASRLSSKIFMWTHYFDAEVFANNSIMGAYFDGTTTTKILNGSQYTYHRRNYKEALGNLNYSGGVDTYSNWMERDDIIKCLHNLKFSDIRVTGETLGHVHGPCMTLLAQKT